MLTVGELVTKLQECDPSSTVVMSTSRGSDITKHIDSIDPKSVCIFEDSHIESFDEEMWNELEEEAEPQDRIPIDGVRVRKCVTIVPSW